MTVINENISKQKTFIFLNKYIDSLGKNVAILQQLLEGENCKPYSR